MCVCVCVCVKRLETAIPYPTAAGENKQTVIVK